MRLPGVIVETDAPARTEPLVATSDDTRHYTHLPTRSIQWQRHRVAKTVTDDEGILESWTMCWMHSCMSF